MPVKVQNILTPQTPSSPPPGEETLILRFLQKTPDKAYTFSEILMGVHSVLTKPKGGEFVAALAGVFLVTLAEAASKKYKTALESLTTKNLVLTREFNKQQYYWIAPSEDSK